MIEFGPFSIWNYIHVQNDLGLHFVNNEQGQTKNEYHQTDSEFLIRNKQTGMPFEVPLEPMRVEFEKRKSIQDCIDLNDFIVFRKR